MLKHRFLFTVTLVFFIIILLYLGYYYFYLENWASRISSELNMDVYSSSQELYISEFKEESCHFNYCSLNNCGNVAHFPCERLKGRYVGKGFYNIRFYLENYLLYPFGKKKKIVSWKLERIDAVELSGIEKTNIEEYVNNLKKFLENNYLWEIYSIPISESNFSCDDLFLLQNVKLDFEYTKSLILLQKLSEKKGDAQLKTYFEREILYLNNNMDLVLSENRSLDYPEAYILKLIDYGLNDKYLSLIQNFDFSVDESSVIEYDINLEGGTLLGYSGQTYTREYEDLIRYADYYRVFDEYGYKGLSEYSFKTMLTLYDSLEYGSPGLCSLVYNTGDSYMDEDILNKLEELFANDKLELFETNIYELLMCKSLMKREGHEHDNLNSVIRELVKNVTYEAGDTKFLVRGEVAGEDNKGQFAIIVYNSLNNLMYILGFD